MPSYGLGTVARCRQSASGAARSRCLCLCSKCAAARMRRRQIEGSEERHDMPPSVATEVPMTGARNGTTCLLCEVNQRPPPSEGATRELGSPTRGGSSRDPPQALLKPRPDSGARHFHPKTLLRERGFSLGVLIASCTANSNLEYKTPKRCERHSPGPSQ